MSSIGSVSTSSLASYYQKLRVANPGSDLTTQSTSSSSSTQSTSAMKMKMAEGMGPPPPPPGDQGDFGNKISSALEDQGLSDDDISTLREQIDQAVSDAKDSSDDPDAVRTAVDGVLKDAGIDMDKFHEDMAPQGAGPDGHQGGGIESVLKQAGIDPSQFKTKLKELLDSGSTDFSSLFANASVGSSVDVAA